MEFSPEGDTALHSFGNAVVVFIGPSDAFVYHRQCACHPMTFIKHVKNPNDLNVYVTAVNKTQPEQVPWPIQ